MKITALTASLSESSSSNRLAERILEEVENLSLTPVQTGIIGIRALAHDMVDSMLTGVPSPDLDEAFAKLRSSDAVILSAPVYNAAPIGLLTTFLQLFPEAGLRGIPVLLASTGGTARHSLAMDQQIRPLVAYLKGLTLPTAVFAATDDWGLPEEQTGLGRRIRSAAQEIVDSLGAAADGARSRPARPAVVDEFDPSSITPFEQLLGS